MQCSWVTPGLRRSRQRRLSLGKAGPSSYCAPEGPPLSQVLNEAAWLCCLAQEIRAVPVSLWAVRSWGEEMGRSDGLVNAEVQNSTEPSCVAPGLQTLLEGGVGASCRVTLLCSRM